MESYISPAFAKGKPAVPRPLPGMASGAGATPTSPGSGELSFSCAQEACSEPRRLNMPHIIGIAPV